VRGSCEYSLEAAARWDIVGLRDRVFVAQTSRTDRHVSVRDFVELKCPVYFILLKLVRQEQGK